MIKSMTGFGKGEANGKCGTIKVEARAVNHKFLDTSIRLPDGLLSLEDRVRELIGKFVKRGKVNISIVYEDGLDAADRIMIDEKAAGAYYKHLLGLKKRFHLDGAIRLDQLITLPGVIKYEPAEKISAKTWPLLEEALKKALKGLDESRTKEGKALYQDIKKRIKIIEKATAVIRERSKVNVASYRERLRASIREISDSSPMKINNGRLEQEVALYAKNSDVTEEIIRILSHVKNLNDTVDKDAEAGKKIDFIAQELHREINTIGSKASDFKISQKVIQIKSEIDKLREQGKNIE